MKPNKPLKPKVKIFKCYAEYLKYYFPKLHEEWKNRPKIDAPKAWGCTRINGRLYGWVEMRRCEWPVPDSAVPVRIIRESDFRELMKARKR